MSGPNGYVVRRGSGRQVRYVVNWRCPRSGSHHTITFDRRHAADKELLVVREGTSKGRCVRCDATSEQLSLGEFIKTKWIPSMEKQAGSPATAAWYETQLRHVPWTQDERDRYLLTGKRPQHGRPDFWAMPLSKFDEQGKGVKLVEQILELRAETPAPGRRVPSQSSIVAVRKTLSRIFSDAIRWGELSTNPVAEVKTPKPSDMTTGGNRVTLERPGPDDTRDAKDCNLLDERDESIGTRFTLTPEMVPSREVVWRLAHEIGQSCPDYEMAVLLAAASGLRYSELMALFPTSFNLEDGRFQIVVSQQMSEVYGKRRRGGPIHRLKAPKSEASSRTVDVAPAVTDRLADFLDGKPRTKVIFRAPEGGLIYRSRFTERMRGAVENVRAWARTEGLEVPETLTLHRLRHRWASETLSRGLGVHEVKRQLGPRGHHGDPTDL